MKASPNIAATEGDDLIVRNLRLVPWIAYRSRYHGRGCPTRDLHAEGYLGLVLARQTYDPRLARFTTYGGLRAKWMMRDAVRDWRRFRFRPLDDEASRRHCADHDFDEIDARLDRGDMIERALRTLKPRTRRIVEMRYGLGHEDAMTLGEIGECVGLTKERVRQILIGAIGMLRKFFDDVNYSG